MATVDVQGVIGVERELIRARTGEGRKRAKAEATHFSTLRISCQTSAEHFRQCAEFLPLGNRGFYDGLSIDEPSLSARVTSIQPASLRSLARCALPYSHGRKRLAEWPQYQVQSGPMQPVSSAIWPAFWHQVSSRI
jgi:hypothetical protein